MRELKDKILNYLADKGEANRAELLEYLELPTEFKISRTLGYMTHAEGVLSRRKKRKPGWNLDVFYYRLKEER